MNCAGGLSPQSRRAESKGSASSAPGMSVGLDDGSEHGGRQRVKLNNKQLGEIGTYHSFLSIAASDAQSFRLVDLRLPPLGAAAALKRGPYASAFKGLRQSFYALHPNFSPPDRGDGRRRGAQRGSFISAPCGARLGIYRCRLNRLRGASHPLFPLLAQPDDRVEFDHQASRAKRQKSAKQGSTRRPRRVQTLKAVKVPAPALSHPFQNS